MVKNAPASHLFYVKPWSCGVLCWIFMCNGPFTTHQFWLVCQGHARFCLLSQERKQKHCTVKQKLFKREGLWLRWMHSQIVTASHRHFILCVDCSPSWTCKADDHSNLSTDSFSSPLPSEIASACCQGYSAEAAASGEVLFTCSLKATCDFWAASAWSCSSAREQQSHGHLHAHAVKDGSSLPKEDFQKSTLPDHSLPVCHLTGTRGPRKATIMCR